MESEKCLRCRGTGYIVGGIHDGDVCSHSWETAESRKIEHLQRQNQELREVLGKVKKVLGWYYTDHIQVDIFNLYGVPQEERNIARQAAALLAEIDRMDLKFINPPDLPD